MTENICNQRCDLSIVIPAKEENQNLLLLIPEIKKIINDIKLSYEIFIINEGPIDALNTLLEETKIKIIQQKDRGYGNAVKLGMQLSTGEYILTMDADYSHQPVFIKSLWEHRGDGDIIIASRYIHSGSADMSVLRLILSKLLNFVTGAFFHLPYKDLSSGFRLYSSKVKKILNTVNSENFDFLLELLIKAYRSNFKIMEVPFHYVPRKHGYSKAKYLSFAISFTKTIFRLNR